MEAQSAFLLLLLLGVFIALFSKQIDAAAARSDRQKPKRAMPVAAVLIAGSLLGLFFNYTGASFLG